MAFRRQQILVAEDEVPRRALVLGPIESAVRLMLVAVGVVEQRERAPGFVEAGANERRFHFGVLRPVVGESIEVELSHACGHGRAWSHAFGQIERSWLMAGTSAHPGHFS